MDQRKGMLTHRGMIFKTEARSDVERLEICVSTRYWRISYPNPIFAHTWDHYPCFVLPPPFPFHSFSFQYHPKNHTQLRWTKPTRMISHLLCFNGQKNSFQNKVIGITYYSKELICSVVLSSRKWIKSEWARRTSTQVDNRMPCHNLNDTSFSQGRAIQKRIPSPSHIKPSSAPHRNNPNPTIPETTI